MKRKDRDELLQWALDSNPDDRQHGDNVDSDELRMLMSLRDELHKLRDLPEPQIGIDRIRKAILDEEIAAKRSAGLPWAAGIAAACTVAAVALWATQNISVTEGLSTGTLDDVVQEPNAASADLVWRDRPAPKHMEVTADVITTHLSARPSRWKTLMASAQHSSRQSGATTNLARMVSSSGSEVKLPDPPPQPESPDVDQPIVVVDSTMDENTGTNVANEIETTGDIVIGG